MRASASFILLTNSQSRPRDLQDQDGLDQWEAGTELKVNMKLLQCWAGLESCSGGDWWNSPQSPIPPPSTMPPPCLHHASAMRVIVRSHNPHSSSYSSLFFNHNPIRHLNLFRQIFLYSYFSLMFQNADTYVKCLIVDISTPKWTQKGMKGHMI